MSSGPIQVSYPFACHSCRRRWSGEYEIREIPDGRGLVQAAFFSYGRRAVPPLTAGRCRFCDSPAITVRRRDPNQA
ncbi:hypothetical protein [Catenulispora rubra]|uniref:hypothetical protein n=1 Tax=Catenulispora rubra TaxID=280293 RepID=UPI00189210B6|nr:hypothetical protein [Catenulispora rubra]